MCFLPATVPVAGSKNIATATYMLSKDNILVHRRSLDNGIFRNYLIYVLYLFVIFIFIFYSPP